MQQSSINCVMPQLGSECLLRLIRTRKVNGNIVICNRIAFGFRFIGYNRDKTQSRFVRRGSDCSEHSSTMQRRVKSCFLQTNYRKCRCNATVTIAVGVIVLANVLLLSTLSQDRENGIAINNDNQLDFFPRHNGSNYLRLLLFEALAANKHLEEKTSFPDDEFSSVGSSTYTNHTIEKYHLPYRNHVPPLVPSNAGKVLNDVTSFRYPIDAAWKHDACSNLLLLAVIISAPVNYLKREIIRRTWASTLSHISSKERGSLLQQASYVFFIGLPNNETEQRLIKEESDTWGDIVQVDYVDSYHLLTNKSVSMLNWALKTCNSTKFFLKIDDDVYLNTYNLMYNIQEMARLEYHQMARIYGSRVPHHLPNRYPGDKKNYIDYKAWPWSTFPNYLNGPCYMIANSALLPLLATAQTVPNVLFEDLYITSLCAKQAGVKAMASERWYLPGSNVVDHCFVLGAIAWESKTQRQFTNAYLATRDIYEHEQFPRVEFLCSNHSKWRQ